MDRHHRLPCCCPSNSRNSDSTTLHGVRQSKCHSRHIAGILHPLRAIPLDHAKASQVPSTANARLDTIPLEILLEILSYLPELSLKRLSLTCKSLHYRIEPVLYRSIEWRFNIPGALDLPDPPIHLFLRSLRENPALAGHVKSVFFGAHEEAWDLEKFEDLPPSSDESGWWAEALKEPCPPIQEILQAGTFAGESGPLMALLLCQLPNLEVLYLEFSVALWSDLLDILFEHHQSPSPRCTCPRFPKMKKTPHQERPGLSCSLPRWPHC